MKILNFTAEKCLKSLLRKIKKQTIRPIPKNGRPRFEKNEKFTIYWNQRSKFEFFCPKCGKPTYILGNETFPKLETFGYLCNCDNCYSLVKPFKKILGFGIITDVFKIEMSNDYHNKLGIYVYDDKKKRYLTENEIIELSILDGFEKPNEFVDFFKKYDLRFVQSFYVYRWKWNE